MIKKNVQFGNIKTTLVELGNGDVMVSACRNKDITGVTFTNDTPKPIGTKHNTSGCTTDNLRPEVIITFTSVASIEVVERHLKKAKIMLRNKK